MKTTLTYAARQLKTVFLCSILFAGLSSLTFGQGITVYQYRQVPADKVDEFIKRETTYWSKVAEKNFAKGNITFWALLEKVGGYDVQNSSNFLFINTYNDIDKIADVWSNAAADAGVTIDKMETNSMSKVTSMLFLKTNGWQSVENAVPHDQYKYLSMIYHQSSDPGGLIAAENKHWAPFIKSAMDKKLIKQTGWGNAVLLSPINPDMKFNTVSYDLYPNLQQTLDPTWDESLVVPEGMTEIIKLENGPRMSVVYRIVHAVSTE